MGDHSCVMKLRMGGAQVANSAIKAVGTKIVALTQVARDDRIAGMAELSFVRRNSEAIVTGLAVAGIVGFGTYLYQKYPTLLAPFTYCAICGSSVLVACVAVIALKRIPKPLPSPSGDNIENYVRTWLDNYGLTVPRDPYDPTYFRYRVTLPAPDNELLTIFRMRQGTPEYIQVYTDLGLKGEHGAQILSKFTDDK